MSSENNESRNHFGPLLGYPQERYDELASSSTWRGRDGDYERASQLYQASRELAERFHLVVQEQPDKAWELIAEHQAVLDELRLLFPPGLLLSPRATSYIQGIRNRKP